LFIPRSQELAWHEQPAAELTACPPESPRATGAIAGERSQGMIHLSISYKSFTDDEGDSGFREAQAFANLLREQAQVGVSAKDDLIIK
jgi:hypothetical protein